MKQMMKIGLLVAICLLTISCGTDPVEEWLVRAEACMEANSDSARRCLQYIEGTGACSDEQRARYALLRTQAMHKCRIPLESDSLINVAVAYYANSNDRHRLALSLLYKGLVHKQNHQVEQAVEAFVASERAFEGVEDNQYKALLFNHYGALLMKQGVYEEALVYYKESYKYKLLGDSIHYVVSACGQIANMYEIINILDSAVAYFELGLSYADRLSKEKRGAYYLLLHDYAAFWINCKNYTEAERLLQDCIGNLENSEYSYTLYSALTTLYYEKKELDKALYYGRQILASDDSLTVCGGYLRLYKIYKDMGQMDSALHYHNLYRQYDSDITLRRQTAKVAAIPHRIKSETLMEENRALTGWRLWLVVTLVTGALVATVIYVSIKRKHRLEQTEKERELAESQTSLHETQTSLADTQNLLTQTKVDLGQMKGVLTHRSHAFDRMKQSLEEMKKKHQEEIRQLKEDIQKLKADIRDLKSNDRKRNHTETELVQNIKSLDKQLATQSRKLKQVEHQREIDRRIEYFMASGWDSVAVDLLLQLRLNKKGTFKYDIRATEHLPLLKELLQRENPELLARLVQCELEENRMILCCLMALGLDDVEMMACAACLAPNSVKTYRKECRELLDSFSCNKS
ncbi:MAG: hypothetical protein IJ013_06845 [Bacteroidaceae bacterium]|nr:hypothetical protein [Bacteroidaceae bacterium]